MFRFLINFFIFATLVPFSLDAQENPGKIIVSYVTSWTDVMPDPTTMTHINYAFGHVNKTFDGVRIDNPDRLRQIVGLKEKNAGLKVLLSIGGWGSGGFSTMASRRHDRSDFVKDCGRIVNEYNLDGIDIDWEYPTSNAAGIDNSPKDTKNFTTLMKDLRKVLGDDKLLTLASVASGEYIDFKAVSQVVDFVNIMSYDMGSAPKHHASLYKSEHTGWMNTSEAVEKHIAAGVPKDKIVVGIPFYGRGGSVLPSFVNYRDIPNQQGVECWDDAAEVPYLADENGTLILGYDNPRSIAIKCKYIIDNGLRGGMYWDYSGDNDRGDLRNTMRDCLLGNMQDRGFPGNYAKAPRFKALIYYSTSEEVAHVQFAEQTVEFMKKLNYGDGFILDVTTDLSGYDYDKLKDYSVVIMPNASPKSPEARKAFEKYMENGGGWVGFHGAGYNDARTNWPWFNGFLGTGTFLCNNWPPQPALLDVNAIGHDVTKNLPEHFVAPASEWYMWNDDPTTRDNVTVLLSLSPKNYPIGIKDVISFGAFPVVWTNVKYRMIYLNMGHGDEEYADATQKLLFINAIRWIISHDPKGNPFKIK